jgi:hypothetical protein
MKEKELIILHINKINFFRTKFIIFKGNISSFGYQQLLDIISYRLHFFPKIF